MTNGKYRLYICPTCKKESAELLPEHKDSHDKIQSRLRDIDDTMRRCADRGIEYSKYMVGFYLDEIYEEYLKLKEEGK